MKYNLRCLVSVCLAHEWCPTLLQRGEEALAKIGLFCATHVALTLPMLRLLLFNAQERKDFWKTIKTLSCWYSLDSSHRELSDEYPFARV